MLNALGIGPGAEKVYRYLLKDPFYDVEELRQSLGWSEHEVREALGRLAELRLVIPGSDGGGGLPAHPASALSFLLARAESELHRRQRELDRARRDASSLASALTSDPALGAAEFADHGFDVVARLTGPEEVRARLAELVASARSECLSLEPGGPRWLDALELTEPSARAAEEQGVTLRTVVQDSARADPGTLGRVRRLAELGGRARAVPVVPLTMVIVDARAGLVPLDPDDGAAGALEVRSPGLVAVQRLLFEAYWRRGLPVGREPRTDSAGLDPRDREVLLLLASGCTDSQVARRLGVSLRTVRRVNAQLTKRLGAHSRFEAGVLSAQRGWV